MVRAGGGRSADRTSDVARRLIRSQKCAEALVQEWPRSHVAWLFLHPDDVLRIRVRAQSVSEHRLRERIELLEPDDRDVRVSLISSSFQIVVDLSAGDHEAGGGGSPDAVVQNRLETDR